MIDRRADSGVPLGADHWRVERSSPVLDSWYAAYTQGDLLYPQTATGLNILVGNVVLSSLRDRSASWRSFVGSKLTDPQIHDQIDLVIDQHRAFRVGAIPKGHTRQGEREFSTDGFQIVYEGMKQNVSTTLFQFSRGKDGNRTSLPSHTTVSDVEDFLDTPKNLETVVNLFSLAAERLNTPTARSISARHKARLKSRIHPARSGRITEAEKEALASELVPFLKPPIIQRGRELAIDNRLIEIFFGNMTEMEIINA